MEAGKAGDPKSVTDLSDAYAKCVQEQTYKTQQKAVQQGEDGAADAANSNSSEAAASTTTTTKSATETAAIEQEKSAGVATVLSNPRAMVATAGGFILAAVGFVMI